MSQLKTSAEWQKECTVTIMDADGWDRQNYDFSWYEEKITRREFEKRMCSSTCKFSKSVINERTGKVNSIWLPPLVKDTDKIDLKDLIELCNEYLFYLTSDKYNEDNDYSQYIFEKTMTTLYGEDIFDDYINNIK